MRVGIRLLGGFEVTVDGRAVPSAGWQRRPAAALVKLLALQAHGRLHREQVMDALWPDLLVDEAAPRLHKAAHFARSALGDRGGIVVDQGFLALFPGAELDVDVTAFERAAAAARRDGDRESARLAVAAYGGSLLPEDLYEPWTEERRESLRRQWLDLLPVAGHLEELVAADPLDEAAHLALVRDHVEAGRRQPALSALDRLTQVFAVELGTAPGPEAAELRRRAEGLPTPGRGIGEVRRPTLPPPRTRLIGRAADLAMVTGLLGRHRVVTLTGPGGAGKSTLALAAARLVEAGSGDDVPDVVLVELAPVRDADGLTRAVAEAAGVQGAGAVHVQSLAATLGRREVLLLLDNCEHLLDASARLVDAVLDAGSGARVLVTSREPLRVDGEVEHRLGSLGAGSAELFVERATAAAGEGAADASDPRVVELCARLDGLPLAIELAAAQLRHVGLPELVDRLDDRLTLLVGGRPRAGERHSALTATIDWSYRLLDDGSRDVFDRLGVLPAGFDLETVHALVPGRAPSEVTNLLGDLVAKSLVVHEPARGRYRLLETIRLFASQRLDESGRRAETLELLRCHLVARATAEPRVQAWLSSSLAARSRDDIDSVRLALEASLAAGDLTAAVDLALGLSTLWRNAVSYADGRYWVDALAARDLRPRDRLWTLLLDADVHLGSGDARMMRRATGAAVALAAEVDDDGAAVIAAIYEAMVHLAVPERAAVRLSAAALRAREAGEPGLERLARGFRMVAQRMRGETEGLREEGTALTDGAPDRDYARYLCHWAASLIALLDRDADWLVHLMDQQRDDLSATALHENWLTLYWGALSLIAAGEDYHAQLRRARARAEAEGRAADVDCVLALAYAAACADEWDRAAELLGVTEGALMHDTAGFIHQTLVRDHLVRPRLDEERFRELVRRGHGQDPAAILRDAGL
ncbi:hypothetical protein EKO23_18800 [Nocardioides guangzhouensis]|uniref:Bacterial transcriptional activator domain-containing protein n=1 Tax=Nocardioides guangzhouensis TaxID=2497878 RepID=A0A4Q4Z7W8_9ACTN|nr:BTAD domain-containing putative transcriptional regulator [Nocardioides guangzhouensis]RYP83515.1 hypothetical protein EKO23_18800 [Nocardioides guangzhouensis]